jgi:cellulose synthase/poly-beta-1,6-N-acetylglucosamine synthase-like glycosyltransferase
MKISLIISYYKNLPALELILKALENQKYKNFEVIVAEDDNSEKTIKFLSGLNTFYPIKHVHQDIDIGFRKNKMLNEAINISTGDLLVFIDGDCIPHRNFLLAYISSACTNTILFGRRVMLDVKLTENLYKEKNLSKLNFWMLLFSKSTCIKYSLYLPFISQYQEVGIWGCNWGVYREQICNVNGFDEDYVTAGIGEDKDIEWRLLSKGLKLKSIRFGALQYHLYHKKNYTDNDVSTGIKLFNDKIKLNQIACYNGLEKKNDSFI